jgi:hypothetical protein
MAALPQPEEAAMIRRADTTVADEADTPEPGVWITVKDEDGNLVTLYNDDGSSLDNPFQSGTLGAFVYNVTTAGIYTEEYRLSLSDSPQTIRSVVLDDSAGNNSQTFAARSDMAAYAPIGGLSTGSNVFLSEAGREGWFIVALASDWSAQIATDTQQGVFVQSTADPTKVFRRHPGIDTWYNLKHFGAKGDGTIDGGGVVHGTDDTAAIQAAVNAVNTLNGSKTLYFPAPSASFYRCDEQVDFSQTTGVTLKSYVNRVEPTNAAPSCAVVYTGTVSPFLKAGQSWSLTIDGPAFQVSNPAFVGDILSTDWSGTGRVTYSTKVINSMFGGRVSGARHARSLLNLCGAVEAYVEGNTFGWADRHIIGRAADSVLGYSNAVYIGKFNRFSEYGIEAINVYGTTQWTIEENVFELKYNTGGGTAGVGNGISDLWLGGGGSRISTNLVIRSNGFWDAYLGKWIDIYGAGSVVADNFAVVNNGGTFLNFNSGFGAKVSGNRILGAAGGTFLNNSGPVMPNFDDDGTNICDGGITYNGNPAGFTPPDKSARNMSVQSSTATASSGGSGGFFHARKAVAGSGAFGGGVYFDRNDDTNWRGGGLFSYLDPTTSKECIAFTVAASTTAPTDTSLIKGKLNQDGLFDASGFTVGWTQVVGARQTGWTAGTGTANKGAFATYAGHTASAAYVQAEAQSTDDATKANSQRIKAIEDALRTHGLIN